MYNEILQSYLTMNYHRIHLLKTSRTAIEHEIISPNSTKWHSTIHSQKPFLCWLPRTFSAFILCKEDRSFRTNEENYGVEVLVDNHCFLDQNRTKIYRNSTRRTLWEYWTTNWMRTNEVVITKEEAWIRFSDLEKCKRNTWKRKRMKYAHCWCDI